MTLMDIPIDAQPAVRARLRKDIDELDYRRQLVLLSQRYSQREISKFLGIAQPSVSSALKTAQNLSMPIENFSGATPEEICRRHAAGFLSREQLVDELSRFPYVKGGTTDGYDTLIVDPPGAWSEVDDAARLGLIDDAIYEEVFNLRHGLG